VRSYGRVWLEKGWWHFKAEPHILLRLKRVFEKISKTQYDVVTLSDSDENRRDLEWFLLRYPLDISERDIRNLRDGARRMEETVNTLEKIVDTKYKPKSYPMALPPRLYQAQAAEIILRNGFLLVADDVGLGKTAEAITCFTNPKTLPALVVTLAGVLPRQWEDEIRKFMPQLTTHIIKSRKVYEIPRVNGKGPDVLITNYHKLDEWAHFLAGYVRMVVFDECQELRRSNSNKYAAARKIAHSARFTCGLSATPIFNYGGEIFNVMDVLKEDCLGNRAEFEREWGTSVGYSRNLMIRDPKAFGSYLREHFLMIRRTREEVKRELPPLQKIPYHIPADGRALASVSASAAALARIILSTDEIKGFDRLRAQEELSYLLRQATGIGKAPYAADFIQMLVENGEQVLAYCWHREVYEIMVSKLSTYNPVLFTGSETPNQKQESFRKFVSGESKVMLMSLRAGQGVDGLQKTCKTTVVCELDWSPACHEQNIGRIFRDGQKDPVTAFFLVTDSGSDPVIADTLGIKRNQIEGIRNPGGDIVEKLQVDPERIKTLARHYLQKIQKPELIPQESTQQ